VGSAAVHRGIRPTHRRGRTAYRLQVRDLAELVRLFELGAGSRPYACSCSAAHAAQAIQTPDQRGEIMAEQQRNHTTTSAPRDDDVLTLDVATPSDSVVTVIAHGEIDIDTAPRLHDCLRQHLRPGGCLVLDTTAVTYCGSSGAAELVGAATAAREVGAEITVVIPATPRHPVRRVLTLLGVLHMLSVRPGPFVPRPRTA
jgi:anti-anti-sigma factor